MLAPDHPGNAVGPRTGVDAAYNLDSLEIDKAEIGTMARLTGLMAAAIGEGMGQGSLLFRRVPAPETLQ